MFGCRGGSSMTSTVFVEQVFGFSDPQTFEHHLYTLKKEP